MSSAAASLASGVSACERLDELFDRLAELTGQRNAIDGAIVDIVAEIDRDAIWGATGVRSVEALVAWKTGVSPRNAGTVVAIARRSTEFTRCTAGLREGRFSLDQVGVIAEHAADGSDAHYEPLVGVATVTQLRTAVKLEPQPQPKPKTEPKRSITSTTDGDSTTWRITLPRVEAATFDAALQSHQDAVVAAWRRDHGNQVTDESGSTPPFPDAVDGFMSLVEAGWDVDAARRPHGQRTTVVVHVDMDRPAALHLGPVLSDAERRELLCDTTCEVWFERHGRPIGAGRTTRTVNRRLRRALELRDRCCAVPGCGATRGLHAHHIRHWEDGGATELDNLVLLCPFHHRLHHCGGIEISGPAGDLVVTDADGRLLRGEALARPPTTPFPAVPPCPGPTGERADWWWYQPFEPRPPTSG